MNRRLFLALLATLVFGASVGPSKGDAFVTNWDTSLGIGTTVAIALAGEVDATVDRWGGTIATNNTQVADIPARIALIEMVRIPAGTYKRGDPPSYSSYSGRPSNARQHTVRISQPFLMAKTEVTQAQWTRVMGNTPSRFKGNDLPVERVSWFDAVSFCNKLSELEGLTLAYRIQGREVMWDRSANGYRLPTEAEWEYACRAGTTTCWNTGDSLTDLARAGWYSVNSNRKTQPVGRKEANAWGLHDMHGNVWEWCWDWWGGYPTGQVTDPVGPSTGTVRVIRGGGWGCAFYPHPLRSAMRTAISPSGSSPGRGFRPVRSAP